MRAKFHNKFLSEPHMILIHHAEDYNVLETLNPQDSIDSLMDPTENQYFLPSLLHCSCVRMCVCVQLCFSVKVSLSCVQCEVH